MKSTIFLLAMLLVAVSATAQHDHDHDHDHRWELPEEYTAAPATEFSRVGFAPRVGLAVQKGLYFEAGMSFDIYKIGYTAASEHNSFSYSNLRPYIAGEILIDPKKFLGGAKLGVEYIRSGPLVGMAAGVDVSHYRYIGREAWLVTPRLMLSFVQVEVFYGYSFFVKNQLTQWLGHHRIGVSTTINPRFWRKKRQMMGRYYDSYVD